MADNTTTATQEPNTGGRKFGDPRLARLYAEILNSERFIDTRIDDWQTNVDYRLNQCYPGDTDYDRTAVPWDWTMTKSKEAQLFSQVPQVRLKERNPRYKSGIPSFQAKVNRLVCDAKVGTAMNECTPDVVNAAGVAAVIVGHESRTEERKIPKMDPLLAQIAQASPEGAAPAATLTPPLQEQPEEPAPMGEMMPEQQGQPPMPGQPPAPPEMLVAPYAIDSGKRYFCSRFSPADLRFPVEFEGSDFDDSPWIGRRGRCTWSVAVHAFRLKPEDKEKVLGQTKKRDDQQLRPDDQRETEEPMVSFYEMFYWRYQYHVDELSFKAIQHVVFVDGLNDRAAINEPWKGQKRVGKNIVGPCKFPIRVETLTYISGEALPPSDTFVGKPMVDFLNRSHSNQLLQQVASLPMRWMDVNRIDTMVQQNLLKGTWQSIIPVIGDGSRAIGEIARANYPDDHFRFDDIAKTYLYEASGVNPNSVGVRGGPAIRSAAEAENIQQNMQSQIVVDRARVVNFFCGIAEVLAGLACTLDDFTPEEREALKEWDTQHTANYYFYETLADSSILLDSSQRYERLRGFLNDTVKSGYVNPKPIIADMALLVGVEPNEVIIDPPDKGPEPANISIRTDSAGLSDPMTLAFLLKTGQAPDEQAIQKAQSLIMQAGGPPQPPAAPPDQQSLPFGEGEQGVPTEDAFPDWNEASRINKRREDGK